MISAASRLVQFPSNDVFPSLGELTAYASNKPLAQDPPSENVFEQSYQAFLGELLMPETIDKRFWSSLTTYAWLKLGFDDSASSSFVMDTYETLTLARLPDEWHVKFRVGDSVLIGPSTSSQQGQASWTAGFYVKDASLFVRRKLSGSAGPSENDCELRDIHTAIVDNFASQSSARKVFLSALGPRFRLYYFDGYGKTYRSGRRPHREDAQTLAEWGRFDVRTERGKKAMQMFCRDMLRLSQGLDVEDRLLYGAVDVIASKP